MSRGNAMPTAPETPVQVTGILDWQEIPGTRRQYGDDNDVTWQTALIVSRSGVTGMVFEPRVMYFDGFRTLAVVQPSRGDLLGACYQQIEVFAKRGVKERRLLWLAFCQVTRVEQEPWVNQVYAQLRQYELNPSSRAVAALLSAVEQRRALNWPQTSLEILGELEY